MTIDEAINHIEEKVKELGCCECSKEHVQLGLWLKELKLYRNIYGYIDVNKKFPIISDKREKEYIPLYIINNHNKQALINHSQSLERLAERGGLSWIEALCVIQDRKYDYAINESDAKKDVLNIIKKFQSIGDIQEDD